MPSKHQRNVRELRSESIAQKISGDQVIVLRCGRWPAKICKKNAPLNIMSAPAKKLGAGFRPRCCIQKNMNAPMKKTCTPMLQLTATESGKIRKIQFSG